jgi:leucyl-tRNA synthetase
VKRYNPSEIEPKWQTFWDDNGTYVADLSSDKKKYYSMSMFNYPSGNLHIGHSMNFTISDVMARFKRQQGYETYHPVGWDSFGLPAENRAIKEGVSPQESMRQLIPAYHKAYKAMGWSNDWTKEIAAHEPEYYKWTQWIFAQMYKAGLAYQDSRMQWWCDIDKTVLSNEQVIDGKCWRHDGPNDPIVAKKEIKQWFFKITEYADEMLEATAALDWTESVKLAQKNWFGKSQGAEIDFELHFDDEKLNENRDADGKKAHIKVFTTRPDTIFGATFLVLAPEHRWVELALGHGNVLQNNDEVAEYVKEASRKSELERMETKDKTGAELKGVSAINPASGEKIPLWTADYVLSGYGTGAIMAVPAHDERDYEFAKQFDLEIKQVVMPIEDDPINPPKPGFEEVARDTMIVHLLDKATGKYALLNWHETLEGTTTAIMGGIEEGQTPEEAALMELREEAALEGVTITGKSRWITGARYCASHKSQNRKAIAWGLTAEIDNLDNQGAIDPAELKNHTITWVEKDKVLESLTPVHQKQVWELLWNETALPGDGELMNSGEFDGLSTNEAREKIVDWLEKKGVGESKTTFKIRDWSVSRQRYWGAPIPIIHCPTDGIVLVPDDQLPVVLPELVDFAPSGDGRSALARATDWLHVKCPTCGGDAERDTDTLDTYIDSSWYYLRYLDPKNNEKIFNSDVANKWMPVDFYNGGDHATAHMIYARFVTRFLYKQGLVNVPEPFKRFLFNGKVTSSDGTMFSKSKGNGVDPLEIINSGYGADALRTYLMFAAPLDIWIRWDSQGVPATHRFLNRVWNLVQEYVDAEAGEASDAILKLVHPAIKKVTGDLEDQKYNTAIAAMMKLTNELYELKVKEKFGDRDNWKFALESLVALVSPFAPHIGEELWHQLGHDTSVHRDSWPQWDDKYLVSDTMTIVVQVNGKLRATLELVTDTSEEDIKAAALAHENVMKFVDGEPRKVIYIPKKLVNIVA